MSASENAAASLTATAADGVPAPPRCPGASSGGTHTLHVEYAVWSASYRIIHTKPDGRREVWRRGLETVEEARMRCLIVEEMLGYEARL